MGDIPFRRLERRGARRSGNQIELALQLPRSRGGMEVRFCPSQECAPRLFQLGDFTIAEVVPADGVSLHRQPHTSGTTCPYCGHRADDDQDFVDPRDIEALTDWFTWAALEDVQDAFGNMFEQIGRSLPRGGPISFEVSTNRQTALEPLIWREDLLRDLTCDVCSRRYGVYAIGLFCPDCGAPNLTVHFRRECDLIMLQIELAKSATNAELSFRLLGNAHEDVVTALETYLKTAYRWLAQRLAPREEVAKLTSAKAIGTGFQNVDRAQKLLAQFEIDPFAVLDSAELANLRLNIQKRHVIGHNLGLADEKYSEIASGEQPGQTVVLLAEEVRSFAELAARVVDAVATSAFAKILLPPG